MRGREKKSSPTPAKTAKPTIRVPRGKPKRLPVRALVGLGLVASSIAGVWWVIHETNDLRPYLVTTEDIPAGTTVSDIAFDVSYLATPGERFDYLTPDVVDHYGHYILDHPLPAHSLVNSATLTLPIPDNTTLFTTDLPVGGAPWLVPGAVVDVWVAAPLDNQGFSAPAVVAAGAVVAGVRADDGFAADSSVVAVDLRVLHRDIAKLIHASANNYSIQVSLATPVSGGEGSP